MRPSCGSYEIQPQTGAPPRRHESPSQLDTPMLASPEYLPCPGRASIDESGPMLWAVQRILPVARSSPLTQPQIPNSPPDGPTITRLRATNGAIGVVSPCCMSAICVFHSSRPETASTATVCPSSTL